MKEFSMFALPITYRGTINGLRSMASFLRHYRRRRHVEQVFFDRQNHVNHCYISQNCIGGRFYQLERRAYTAPTVGLWFKPADFLIFCHDLEYFLGKDVQCDESESARIGYPVGRIDSVAIYFQHYRTFEDARSAWLKRSSRVQKNDVRILMTDRDGFTSADRERFIALPYKKILFSYKYLEDDNVIHVPGFENMRAVGDLYSEYYHFSDPGITEKIFSLLKL